MNELTIREDMSFEELQSAVNQITMKQNERLFAIVQDLKEDLTKVETKVHESNSTNEELRRMEIARHRAEENRYGFVSQSDLGQMYEVSIGSKTMGKLLRLSGLAKAKQSTTEPMRSAIMNDYAKSKMYADHPNYQWNPEKCIKKIDEWLNSVGVIDEFYSIESEDKLKDFINELDSRFQ